MRVPNLPRFAVIALILLGFVTSEASAGQRPKKRSQAEVARRLAACRGQVTLKKGDSLSKVATRNDMTVKQLRELNKLKKGAHLAQGMTLKVKRPDYCSAMEAEQEAEKRAAAKKGKGWTIHKVKKGETVERLAKKYKVKPEAILKANGLRKGKALRAGLVLRIVKKNRHALKEGEQLPNGVGYVRMRPDHAWGTPGSIRTMQDVFAQFAARNPTSVPAMVADLSKKGGGHLSPHMSHQRGVDVDIGYLKVDNKRTRGLEVMTVETLDVAKTWDLLRLFLNTGHVTDIFMDYELQGALYEHLKARGYSEKLLEKIVQYPRPPSERVGFIRHYRGHHHHFHVRFDCTRPDDPCAPAEVAMIPDRPLPKVAIASASEPEERTKRVGRGGQTSTTVAFPEGESDDDAPFDLDDDEDWESFTEEALGQRRAESPSRVPRFGPATRRVRR